MLFKLDLTPAEWHHICSALTELIEHYEPRHDHPDAVFVLRKATLVDRCLSQGRARESDRDLLYEACHKCGAPIPDYWTTCAVCKASLRRTG